MTECLRCGARVESPNCPACTWPHAPEGWERTGFRIRRLTLDTSCVNEHRRDVDLNTLEAWSAEGKITIERTPALLDEIRGAGRIVKARQIEPQPQVFVMGMSALDGDAVLAGPALDVPTLATILFPTTTLDRLTRQQRHDIAHLQHHVRTGGDCFVTKNPNDFIERGKQEALYRVGIWAFTPAQMVAHLQEHWRRQA